MALPAKSTWILSMKVVLISAGIVSISMATKVFVPVILHFALNEVPMLWSTVVSWLKPPYLYLIINCIIITIAASSRLYQKLDDHLHHSRSDPPFVSPKPSSSDLNSDFAAVSNQSPPVVYDDEVRVLEVNRFVMNGDVDEDDKFVISTELIPSEFRAMDLPAVYADELNFPEPMNGSEIDDVIEEDEVVISNSTSRMSSWEIQTEYLFPVTEKPLVSARFGHRKPVRASPEGGRALKVAKPKRHETMETTWKMITDGHMPLTRHLRRSEAWDNHDRQINVDPPDETSGADRVNSVGSAKLKKDPSLSQDELNRRVEAFIKKFNEDIMLQRQESLQQYTEMINRGAN